MARMTCSLALMLLVVALGAQAQDVGIPDTVELVVTVSPDAQLNQLQLQLDLWAFNDEELAAASVGFNWDNPNLQLDSVVATPLTDGGFGIGPFFFEDNNINITNANQRALFGAVAIVPLFPGSASGRRLWASYYFTLSSWNESDVIHIDTLAFNDASKFQFVLGNQTPFIPNWVGGLTIIDPNAPADLILSNNELSFNSIEGDANPPHQEFTITSSTGDPLDFSMTEDAPWLIVSPLVGNTPRNIRVDINNIGLAAGSYIDTVVIESATAANTPLEVEVTLEVSPPPPTIAANPNVFFFNAIAGDANPDPKVLTITNTGGSILNWTVSNNELWLDLNPLSGIDSGDVSVSVDIAGLPFGDYFDTITVSDVNATNDPVLIPVNLSVASDLPIIVVDSPSNFIIINTSTRAPVDSAFFYVRNGGAGTMNFWVESGGSPRIFRLDPDTVLAPDSVKVVILKVAPGNDFHDTVWVFSDQAINSPVPVELVLHYVSNPASFGVTPKSLSYSTYECSQGVVGLLPIKNSTIHNFGGDDPLDFELVYESDLFTIIPTTGTAPQLVTLFAKQVDLPIGSYFDTVLIYGQRAINSPETLFIQHDVIAGTDTPQIFLMDSIFTLTAQEDHGPILPKLFTIRNKFGGCMDWSIQESVPWAVLSDSSGNVPDTLTITGDAFGLTFGEYADSFFIEAASASNNPRKVRLLFKVWRLHGDNNYDNALNILDLTYFVDFTFRGSGLRPQPEFFVGDVNCDERVNIEDLTYLVDYFFRGGLSPCGNPTKK